MENIDNWTLHIVKNGKCRTCAREFARSGRVYAKRDGSLFEGVPPFGKLEECVKQTT